MQELVKFEDAALLSVAQTSGKVDTQRRIISTMRPGDPVLPYAKKLLLEMEQSAALAKMTLICSCFDSELR